MPLRFCLFVLTALLCLAQAAPGVAAQGVLLNRVAAVVNGELITLYDLQRQAMPVFMRQGLTGDDSYAEMGRQAVMRDVLNSMILDILIRQEAERYKVAVDEKEVEAELRMLAQSNRLSQEELELRLAAEGSSLADIKVKIRDSILRQRMITAMIARKVQVSREEIQSYYQNNPGRFSTQSSVSLSIIVFSSGADAEAARKRIQEKKISFADAARRYSKAPNASLGGQMGDIPWKDLNPVWSQALSGLAPGQVSPILSQGGEAVLLHVDALQKGSTQNLEEVSAQIEEELRAPKLRERFEEYADQLRSQAMVDVRL